MKWLQLIRFPNLLIVALTQYLLEYLILLPHFRVASISPLLDEFHFFLLVLTTTLIAASGYVINDLKDVEIDKKNKPEKQIIGNYVSIKNAYFFYYSLVISGFLIALYLAIYVQNLPLLLIYPAAVFLLWIYSEKYKKTALWGNIIVAIFCSFVAGIIWFAERAAYWQMGEEFPIIQEQLFIIFSIYLIFAFLSTMFREIIKDIEDREGDASENCQTFPIKYGVQKSKILVAFFGILLLTLILIFIQFLFEKNKMNGIYFSIFALIFPIIFSLFKLLKANTKKDFHQLSQFAKLIMLGGIFLLLALKM